MPPDPPARPDGSWPSARHAGGPRGRGTARRGPACSCRSRDTPVTAVRVPSGMSASTPWRLWSVAPRIRSQRGPAGRRRLGTAMRFSPVRYCPGERLPCFRDRTGVDDAPAVLAGAGAELEHVVGLRGWRRDRARRRRRCCRVAQPPEQRQQPVGVPRVQADRGLVEHVQRIDQPGAERVGERDALRLAARERAGLAVEREVAEPDVAEEAEAGSELVEDEGGDLPLERRQARAPSPTARARRSTGMPRRRSCRRRSGPRARRR